jgi:hypothetical protein
MVQKQPNPIADEVGLTRSAAPPMPPAMSVNRYLAGAYAPQIVLQPRQDKFMPLAEAAKYLHCTYPTLRRYHTKGKLPAPVGFGKRGYWQSTLDEFLERPEDSNETLRM